jgi:hypothetical protein
MLTANASAHTKTRIHELRLSATAGELVTANFRGALNPGETLTNALWESEDAGVAGLVSGTVSVTESVVKIQCPRNGHTYLRCQVTTSAGRTLNQSYYVMVQGGVFPDGAAVATNSLLLVVA